MKGVLSLFVKDLREHRSTIGVLVGATAVLYGYVVLRVEGEGAALFLAVFPIWTTLLILPFVLVHAFTVEWRSLSHYLMLSLPVPRWTLAASKCVTVLLAGTAVTGVALAGVGVLATDMPQTSQLLSQMGTTPKRVMAFACGQYLSFLTLFVGVAMGAIGVRHAAHRWRGPAVAGFLAASLYLFLRYLFYFVQAVGGQVGLAWTSILYPALFGSAFLILGLVLYDRRVDV